MITALVLIPLAVALLLMLLPARAAALSRWVGAGTMLLLFVDLWQARFAPDEQRTWLLRPFTTSLHLGLGTGLSFWLTALCITVTFCAILAARVPRMRSFVALLVLLDAAMTGLFLARDLLLFALLWDVMLLPVFATLIAWTGHTTAAWRYLLMNALGGLTLLLAVAAFGIAYGTTDVIGRGGFYPLGVLWGGWIFAGIAFAFLIKTPVWPLHSWMPETYSELPAPMAALVSGVQSKAGLYGFIVICLPLFGHQMHVAAPLLTALGLIGLLYGAVIALIQRDARRILAYSSLSHLGLILIALAHPVALPGAMLYLIGHGIFSAALFLIVGYVELREDTSRLSRLGGLGRANPRLAGALLIAALAALGLPGLVGFAGEITILAALFRDGLIVVSLLALIPVVLAAAYALRLFQQIAQGPPVEDLPQRNDLNARELVALAPLVAAFVLFGLDPQPLLTLPEVAFHATAIPLEGIHQ